MKKRAPRKKEIKKRNATAISKLKGNTFKKETIERQLRGET